MPNSGLAAKFIHPPLPSVSPATPSTQPVTAMTAKVLKTSETRDRQPFSANKIEINHHPDSGRNEEEGEMGKEQFYRLLDPLHSQDSRRQCGQQQPHAKHVTGNRQAETLGNHFADQLQAAAEWRNL